MKIKKYNTNFNEVMLSIPKNLRDDSSYILDDDSVVTFFVDIQLNVFEYLFLVNSDSAFATFGKYYRNTDINNYKSPDTLTIDVVLTKYKTSLRIILPGGEEMDTVKSVLESTLNLEYNDYMYNPKLAKRTTFTPELRNLSYITTDSTTILHSFKIQNGIDEFGLNAVIPIKSKSNRDLRFDTVGEFIYNMSQNQKSSNITIDVDNIKLFANRPISDVEILDNPSVGYAYSTLKDLMELDFIPAEEIKDLDNAEEIVDVYLKSIDRKKYDFTRHRFWFLLKYFDSYKIRIVKTGEFIDDYGSDGVFNPVMQIIGDYLARAYKAQLEKHAEE
jgi:hypothetical protein